MNIQKIAFGFIGTVIALIVVAFLLASRPSWEPDNEFLEKPIVLIYPTGPGGMGYKVQRLVDICRGAKGSISWSRTQDDVILICERTDPLTKRYSDLRWLLRPTETPKGDGSVFPAVALISLAMDRETISRSELEALASSF